MSRLTVTFSRFVSGERRPSWSSILVKHHYHAGEANPSHPAGAETGVRVPVVIEPTPAGSLGWQSDPATLTKYPNLFEAVTALLP
jgi:hypothetical protein